MTFLHVFSVLGGSAVLFLALSVLFELFCVFLYAFVFGKLPIVKYFRKKAALEGSKTVASDLAAAGIHTTEVETVNCFKSHEKFNSYRVPYAKS